MADSHPCKKAKLSDDEATTPSTMDRSMTMESLTPSTTSSMTLSVEESDRRMEQLRLFTVSANSPSPADYGRNDAQSAPQPKTKNLFSKISSMDMLFLVDATGSMQPHIDKAKAKIREMVAQWRRRHLHEAEVRVAIVAYRDHKDKQRLETLDFTTDVEVVYRFLHKLWATGGADTAEDVMGGLERALTMSWKGSEETRTRTIVHICDAPGHGPDLHDFGNNSRDHCDDYYMPGSEPLHSGQREVPTHSKLLPQVIQRGIHYVMFTLTSDTDRMAYRFFQTFHERGAPGKLLTTNKYFGASLLDKQNSNDNNNNNKNKNNSNSYTGNARFEEDTLRGNATQLNRHLQMQMRSAAQQTWDEETRNESIQTAARTIRNVRIQQQQQWPGKMVPNPFKTTPVSAPAWVPAHPHPPSNTTPYVRKYLQRKPDGDLIVHDETDEVETEPTRWDTAEEQAWLHVEHDYSMFLMTVRGEGNSEADAEKVVDEAITSDETTTLQIQPFNLKVRRRVRPFAKGSLLTATYCRPNDETKHRKVIKKVQKEHKTALGGSPLAAAVEAMRVQTVCHVLARQFSRLVPASGLDIVEVVVLQDPTDKDGQCCELMEDCLEEEKEKWKPFQKYNALTADVKLAAFSHYTFERSRGQLLFTDLHGTEGSCRRTNPTVHTRDPTRFKLTASNQGVDGMKQFFAAHECNEVCRQLQLQSKGSMFVEGFSFRGW